MIIQRMAWLTDLHFERVGSGKKRNFLNQLRKSRFEAAVITGDIGCAASLPGELTTLAETCAPRPVYFVLGNHDYYGSSFSAVERAVAVVCAEYPNLHHLDREGIVPLSRAVALIGHGGWADLQAGYGERTVIHSPDSEHIADFQGREPKEATEKMRSRARASAAHFRRTLPQALGRFRHVWIATHVPPFHQALFHDGKPCGPLHAPHFGNLTAGRAIVGIARQFYNRRIGVLCGHTHHPATCVIPGGITVRVGGAQRGSPKIEATLEL